MSGYGKKSPSFLLRDLPPRFSSMLADGAVQLEIAHPAYLVEKGRIVMSGTAELLWANPDIVAAHLGGGYSTDSRRRKRFLV